MLINNIKTEDENKSDDEVDAEAEKIYLMNKYINEYPRLVCQEGEKWVIQLAGKTLAAATISALYPWEIPEDGWNPWKGVRLVALPAEPIHVTGTGSALDGDYLFQGYYESRPYYCQNGDVIRGTFLWYSAKRYMWMFSDDLGQDQRVYARCPSMSWYPCDDWATDTTSLLDDNLPPLSRRNGRWFLADANGRFKMHPPVAIRTVFPQIVSLSGASSWNEVLNGVYNYFTTVHDRPCWSMTNTNAQDASSFCIWFCRETRRWVVSFVHQFGDSRTVHARLLDDCRYPWESVRFFNFILPYN